jgi:uncharacterized protein YbaR (Trm112 family)
MATNISPDLLALLCCPETHQQLELADPAQIEQLNREIASGQVRNRAGRTVREPLESALVRKDRKLLYPIRQGIPVMLIDEAIPMGR